jgi:hypothetical protein
VKKKAKDCMVEGGYIATAYNKRQKMDGQQDTIIQALQKDMVELKALVAQLLSQAGDGMMDTPPAQETVIAELRREIIDLKQIVRKQAEKISSLQLSPQTPIQKTKARERSEEAQLKKLATQTRKPIQMNYKKALIGRRDSIEIREPAAPPSQPTGEPANEGWMRPAPRAPRNLVVGSIWIHRAPSVQEKGPKAWREAMQREGAPKGSIFQIEWPMPDIVEIIYDKTEEKAVLLAVSQFNTNVTAPKHYEPVRSWIATLPLTAIHRMGRWAAMVACRARHNAAKHYYQKVAAQAVKQLQQQDAVKFAEEIQEVLSALPPLM